YLFAGSHDAAQRTAMIYSFLGTCKQHEKNPFLWLRDALTNLPDCKTSGLDTWLPQNYSSQD
ncbi:MAG: IS66 family transposase, partial [Bacteroidales bacterium]